MFLHEASDHSKNAMGCMKCAFRFSCILNNVIHSHCNSKPAAHKKSGDDRGQ